MKQDELEVQLVTTLEQLEAVGPVWRSLYSQSDASPYCSFEWFRDAVRETPEPKNVSFCICVIHDSSGPAGIVPLQLVRGLFATRLKFLAGGQAAANTCLLTPRLRGRQPVRTASEWVLRHHRRWDYCLFRKVMEGTQVHEELSSMVSRTDGRGRIEEVSLGDNVHIELPGSWTDYAAGLSTAHRQNISRRSRKLEKMGSVRFERHGLEAGTSGADLERALEDALAVCRSSWQGSADVGRAICDDDQVDFFRAVSRSAAMEGRLDLSLLYLDARPVAFIWGMSRKPIANIATLAFDPALKAASPGLVHMARYIQDSIDRGFTAIDFGHEFSEYKRKWSKIGQPLFNYFYYPSPRLGRMRHRLQNRWQGSVRYRLQRWRRNRTVDSKQTPTPAAAAE